MEIITVQFSTVRSKTFMAEFHVVIMGNYTKQSCLKTQNRYFKDIFWKYPAQRYIKATATFKSKW